MQLNHARAAGLHDPGSLGPFISLYEVTLAQGGGVQNLRFPAAPRIHIVQVNSTNEPCKLHVSVSCLQYHTRRPPQLPGIGDIIPMTLVRKARLAPASANQIPASGLKGSWLHTEFNLPTRLYYNFSASS